MSKVQRTESVVRTKGIENYLVAAVKIRPSQHKFWQRISNRLTSKQSAKKAVAHQLAGNGYEVDFVYERYTLTKQLKLNLYSVAVSLFSRKTYNQVMDDKIKQMNDRIVKEIKLALVKRGEMNSRLVVSEAQKLISASANPPSRLLIEAMIDDFKTKVTSRAAKVNK